MKPSEGVEESVCSGFIHSTDEQPGPAMDQDQVRFSKQPLTPEMVKVVDYLVGKKTRLITSPRWTGLSIADLTNTLLGRKNSSFLSIIDK